MRISILGSGWLGVPLALYLQKAGHTVQVSTTRAERIEPLRDAGLSACEVRLDEAGQKAPDFWDADVLVSTVPPMSSTEVEILIEHLENSNIHSVLWVSATSVYPDLNRAVHEDDAVHRVSPHSGYDLLALEKQVQAGLSYETTVVRFCGLFGPDRQPGRFFRPGATVRQADAPVNLIHLDDCVSVLSEVIEQQQWGLVLNACSDEHPSRRELYSKAARIAGRPEPVFEEGTELAYKVVDSEKLKTALNYRFIHPNPLEAL